MIRSGGLLFAIILTAFLGAELWFVLKVVDRIDLRLNSMQWEGLNQGFQRVVNPSTGQYDNNVYTKPVVYKYPAPGPDYYGIKQRQLDFMEKGLWTPK